MAHVKWLMKKYGIWLVLLLIIVMLVGIALETQKRKEDIALVTAEEAMDKEDNSETVKEREEKGYDLPINPEEQKEAENDCKILLEKIRAIYEQADKGKSINVVLSDETKTEMLEVLKETGQPLIVTTLYTNMENAEKIEKFIETSEQQKSGEVVMYDLCADGGLNREKFSYDGKDMYVFSTRMTWNEQNEPMIIGSSYTRIKNWEYTDKGWFHYELCVPEYPEVSEDENGTTTVTIDAVCERIGTDCYMTHKLTVRLQENGIYQYLGNEIMGDGLERMPDYIDRLSNEWE
ncbi:MAG: DUF6070 family protein [Lachnospiraceae bacterium]|nr:DUF6070 family protein [Lachnospiraceae bacterium]